MSTVLSHLHTFKQDHSITEASIALFLVHAPVDYSKFRKLMKEDAVRAKYATYNAKAQKNFKGILNTTTEKITTDDLDPMREVGFTIESFNNAGQPDYIISSESGQNNVLSLHNFDYNRWQNFIDRFKEDMPLVVDVQPGLFVKHIGVAYVDQFAWTDHSYPALEEIFVENDYIPKKLLTVNKEWDYKFTAHTDDAKGMDVIESVIMNISRQPNAPFILSISHSVIAALKNPAELTQEFITGDCAEMANSLHLYNKRFLANCLQPVICERIGLKL